MKTKLQTIFIRMIALVIILALMPSGLGLANAGPQPEPAEPFDGEASTEMGYGFQFTPLLTNAMALSSGDVFQNGADRLSALQNNDGGWDWPLNDGNPASVSPQNTLGPIGQGLALSYLHTGDPNLRAALQKTGVLLLAKTNTFSPSDGYLAATLDDIFDTAAYSDHVLTNFYEPLAAGTYKRKGDATSYSTASYVNRIRTTRANLAAWDIGLGLVGAAAVGADTAPWIAGVSAAIDQLNSSAYYDVIGLAGAIYGLAYVGADYDPQLGPHATANSLADLGVILADYQLATGGFTWNAGAQGEGEGNETIQETAYAILALEKLDRATYLAAIQAAADYTSSVQLGTGGWESYAGGAENNEITGEALWAIHVVYSDTPAPIIAPAVNGTLGANGWYISDVTVSWTVSDPDSIISSTSGCDPMTVNVDTQGETVTCTAIGGGDTSSQSITIQRDATPPTLAPTVSSNHVLLNGAATATPNASDATSGVATSSCDPVDTSTVGTHSVTCYATDTAGNSNFATASYTVGYGFDGFFSPVDNLPAVNIAKAGQAIPLKWRLTDANGAPVLGLANATIQAASLGCSASSTLDSLEEYAASASGLQNLGDGYYQFNWKTPTSYANSCRTLKLDLGEGTPHTAQFQFKK